MAILKSIVLPDFGSSEILPAISPEVYHKRRQSVIDRMTQAGLDVLLVYGDREHFANLAYMTGFDPRFEEALLLLDRAGRAKLLAGNECMGYLPDPALGISIELFQGFSLMGQPRDRSRPLRKILADFGIRTGCRVGCSGWKYYEKPLFDGGEFAMDIPSYLADLLRDLAGAKEQVVNTTDIFIGSENGLRLINEPEQIAVFEYASSVTSSAVLELLRHIKQGVREDALERYLDSRGLPLSCHRMIGFGEKAKRGLASASGNPAFLGDTFTTAFGVTGALTCRAGMVAWGSDDLSGEVKAFFPHFASNYFDVVRAWYESLRVGARAGDVYAVADETRDSDLYDFAVNPGHYLHLDEWVHSPFYSGSNVILRSGMALQMDIIPVSKGPFCYINAEDGVIIADETLRNELETRYPEMWQRICKRRKFMVEKLGIAIDESVLPISNIPGWLPPYALNLQTILTAGN